MSVTLHTLILTAAPPNPLTLMFLTLHHGWEHEISTWVPVVWDVGSVGAEGGVRGLSHGLHLASSAFTQVSLLHSMG